MKYEIVHLEEKILVGIDATTSNDDPKMGEIIGGLWSKFYQDGVHACVKNKANEYAIGLYSDYNENNYCVTVGNEVFKAENEDLTVKIIPAGRYAKFSVFGSMQKAVATAWEQIWQMDLERSFTGDFEEYKNTDFKNCHIDIYIALK